MRYGFAACLVLCVLASPSHAQEDKARVLARAVAEARDVYTESGADSAVKQVRTLNNPRLAAVVFSRLVMDVYWQEKDLEGVITLARAGVLLALDRAGKSSDDPKQEQWFKGVAKGIAYNLASFTWPGWGQEGIEIRPEHLATGLKAAQLSLRLARELGQPPGALSACTWVVGAQLLALGRRDAARKAFLSAKEQAEAAKSREGAAMSEGYAALAGLLHGAAGAQEAYAAALAALEKIGTGDAKFFAAQIEKAKAVFLEAAERDRKQWRLKCGPLTLDICLSRTAHLFHVVDQLSRWSPYCHAQYRRSMKLSEEDEKQLALYAAIRRSKGWGGGMEQVFYTRDNFAAALFAAAKAGVLTAAEVEVVRQVIAHFAERVDKLLASDVDHLRAFITGIDAKKLAVQAAALARFSGVGALAVPVYPIANPGKGFGGGFNGGRLTVEVPRDEDITTVFLHEIAHAFFLKQRKAIAAAADRTKGLDFETLSEGLAYAFAPGIHHTAAGDPLAKRVEEHRSRGEGLADPKGYARFRIYALALRPALTKALKEGTLTAFLPKACEVWRSLAGE